MSRTEIIAPPPARSWRDIPQQVKPRAMSSGGRRRLVWRGVRVVAAVALLAGLAWGGLQIAGALDGRSDKLANADSVPVKDVVLVTDGVLDQKWLVRTLALPKGATLMQLDLYQLRARLTASGQVRTAALTRTFPSTLTVTLVENTPVARVMAREGDEAPHPYLVARDGTVFDGVGFDPSLVATLPWLDGMTLTRSGGRFAPIADMPAVAALLAKAKLEAEHLYRTWRVVSLARLAIDHEIVVRSTEVEAIRFSTKEDYFMQLARLDALLDAVRSKIDQPIHEIDLSIGAQVPVAFTGPALPAATNETNVANPVPATGRPFVMEATVRLLPVPASPNFKPNIKL